MLIAAYRRYSFPFLAAILAVGKSAPLDNQKFVFAPNPKPTQIIQKTAPINIQQPKKEQIITASSPKKRSEDSQEQKWLQLFIEQSDKDGRLLDGVENCDTQNEDIQNFVCNLLSQFQKKHPLSKKTLFDHLREAGVISSKICQFWEEYIKENRKDEQEYLPYDPQIEKNTNHIKIESNKKTNSISNSPFSPTTRSNLIPSPAPVWIKFFIEQKEKGQYFIQGIALRKTDDKNILNFVNNLCYSFQKEYPDSEKTLFTHLFDMALIDQETCEFWEKKILSDENDEYGEEMSYKMQLHNEYNDIIEQKSYGHHLLKSWKNATHIDFDFKEIPFFNAGEAAKSSANEIEQNLLLYKAYGYNFLKYQGEFTKHIARLKNILDPNNKFINDKESDPRKQIFVINLCETLRKHFEALILQCSKDNKESLVFYQNNTTSSFQKWSDFHENALSGIQHFYSIVHVTWGASINHNEGFFAQFQKWIPLYIDASFSSLIEIYKDRHFVTKTFTNIGKSSNTREAFQKFYEKLLSFTQTEKLMSEEILKQKKTNTDKVLDGIDEKGRNALLNPIKDTINATTQTIKNVWGWWNSSKDNKK